MDVYTVPPSKQATLSTVVVCNQSKSRAAFRVAVAVAGAADTEKQYLYRDEPIDGNRSFPFTLGVTMGAGDVLRVYSSSGRVSFNVFGSEGDA